MTVKVTFYHGHLDRSPKCKHGRVKPACECWATPDDHAIGKASKE